MSMAVFVQQLMAQNVTIFQHSKDQCDLCCQFKKRNTNEDTLDVDRVTLSPTLKAGLVLQDKVAKVHNYTIFGMATRATICYLWNESEGAVTANVPLRRAMIFYIDLHGEFIFNREWDQAESARDYIAKNSVTDRKQCCWYYWRHWSCCNVSYA